MKKSYHRCPIKGVVHAGVLSLWSDTDGEYIDFFTSKSGTYYALKVTGECMASRIYDGDYVIVREQKSVENNEIAIVSVDESEITISKIVYYNTGIMLVPLNVAYTPRFYTKKECDSHNVRIIGKAIEFKAISNFV